MRMVSLLLALVVLGALVGCGKDGPAQPATLTPEQEQKFREEEKSVANEEERHQAERGNKAPVTSDQQAETEERQHRTRR